MFQHHFPIHPSQMTLAEAHRRKGCGETSGSQDHGREGHRDHHGAQFREGHRGYDRPAAKAPKFHGGKKATGLNGDGMKVMRYRDLMRELAAYTRNTLRFNQAEKATLTHYPTPSPLQQKAFDLLRLNPAL